MYMDSCKIKNKINKLSIESSAVPSDLTSIAGLDTDTSELSHGGDERAVEGGGVVGEVEDGGLRVGVSEEHFVGREKSLLVHQILEVDVVEGPRRDGVHVDGDSGVNVAGAGRHELLGVVGVEGWVDGVRRCEWVDPVGEAAAVGEPQRVGSGEGDHVDLWEVVAGKDGVELVEVGRWLGEFTGHARGKWDSPVAAT